MQFKFSENKYILLGIKAWQLQIIISYHMGKLPMTYKKEMVGKLFSIQPTLQESPNAQDLKYVLSYHAEVF